VGIAIDPNASPPASSLPKARCGNPDVYWYFVDLRRNQRLPLTPGKEPELVRTTIGGNGTTFDLQGRLIVCEGATRRLTRMGPDGKVESRLCENARFGFCRGDLLLS
jgi:hypothetical protein